MRKPIMFLLSTLLILTLTACATIKQSQESTCLDDTSNSLITTDKINTAKGDQKTLADGFEIKEDENGLKTIITKNGKLSVLDLLHEDRWSMIDQYFTSEKLIKSFKSASNDKMLIRCKKVSSKSYYAEDITDDIKYNSCLFTITEIEVLEIIDAKFDKMNVKEGDIIKIYEKYAFAENENGELVSEIAVNCSRPLGDQGEYFISVYYNEEQDFIEGNPKEHFGNVLDGVWLKGFTRYIISDEMWQELERKHEEIIEQYKEQGKSIDNLWFEPNYYKEIKEYFKNID